MKNLFVLALLIFSFSFATTVNAQTPQVGKTYYIQSAVSSARYLAPKSGGKYSKTIIVIDQKTNSNKAAMQWTLKNAGGGYYSFVQKISNQAVDVKRTGTIAKTPLWLWTKHNGTAQKFKLKPARDGYFYLIPKVNSNLRLDVQGGRTTAGTPVWTFGQNGTSAQKWKFIEVPSTSQTGAYVTIPKNQITGFANLIMSGLQLRLNNFGPRHRDRNGDINWYKANDSYIRLGGNTTMLDIPPHVYGLRDKMLFFNDVNLRTATTSFEGNRFVLTLRFEENGTELKGMCSNCARFREDNAVPDYQINRHTWKIYLKLIPYNRSIAFEVEDVRFLGELDGQVFGELFEGIVQNKLIPIMQSKITETLHDQRAHVAREIKRAATAAGYRFDNVRSVYADGNNVTVLTR